MAGPDRILICDDEPTLRELMRVALDPAYEFFEAADGAEAIGLAEQVQPDVVLLDVMMPVDSGLAVLEHIRRDPALSRTPVIMISAFSTPDDRSVAFDLGATAFLGKPFDPDELRTLVEELLDRTD
jgi:two-component system alkaline phosphatase synthesis response regulator PhoP